MAVRAGVGGLARLHLPGLDLCAEEAGSDCMKQLFRKEGECCSEGRSQSDKAALPLHDPLDQIQDLRIVIYMQHTRSLKSRATHTSTSLEEEQKRLLYLRAPGFLGVIFCR
jgi:hypothetical protein